MDRDKIREVAKKIVDGFLGDSHFVADNPAGQFIADGTHNLLRFHLTEQCEGILREALLPPSEQNPGDQDPTSPSRT